MSTLENVFDAMNQFIDDKNEESETIILKRKQSNWYKKFTDAFFFAVHRLTRANVKDVEYRDSYYIFPKGKNGVVQFKITSRPDWLFGIWYDIVKSRTGKKVNYELQMTLFTQYIIDIDKFKPSASEYVVTEKFDLREFVGKKEIRLEEHQIYDAIKLIRFIREHEAVAWVKSYQGIDLNTHYVSESEAIRLLDEHIQQEKDADKLEAQATNHIIAYVRDNVLPFFCKADIRDRGDGVHPRYQLFAYFDDNKELARRYDIEGPGFYSIDDIVPSIILESIDDMVEDYKRRLVELNRYFFRPIDFDIYFAQR